MPKAVLFICLALILYTFSIFRERRIGRLNVWLVVVFAAGFIGDLAGTSIMIFRSTAKFALVLHSVCGYFALALMLAHLIWAILALKEAGKYQIYFTKYSIYAWAVWVIAFISGMPKASRLISTWFS